MRRLFFLTVHLKGITWNHSRGFLPMAATSQRFEETHPGVTISWEKRSLQEFADQPIETLVGQYDLLVIDHPWAGFAADKEALLPLHRHIPADYLAEQAEQTVGGSHASYALNGYQCALAIDAATPVAAWRPDLLERHGLALPDTWEELIQLARTGRVIMPGIPIDSLMNFYMLCLALGEEPFTGRERVVSADIGAQALERLRELAALCTPDIFGMNPIAVYEALSSREDYVYCPFAYGYSNYARDGYAASRLAFGELVSFGGSRLRSTLGGTGLAISAACKHPDVAVAYAMYAASPETQRTLFTESGGQPGHRSAWTDPETNRRTGNYFADTLAVLDRAYIRPRYDGYLHFQDHAGDAVRGYMMGEWTAQLALDRMNELYGESLRVAAKED